MFSQCDACLRECLLYGTLCQINRRRCAIRLDRDGISALDIETCHVAVIFGVKHIVVLPGNNTGHLHNLCRVLCCGKQHLAAAGRIGDQHNVQ
ncbi:hypothetical protein SDC9_184742 [bioreactor metagenome]|uniref:Uncharacterized protein n=1 Tax=bioreactor metagenome TaxID=1076179 RepID=A0A645HF83_9ZZZZ